MTGIGKRKKERGQGGPALFPQASHDGMFF